MFGMVHRLAISFCMENKVTIVLCRECQQFYHDDGQMSAMFSVSFISTLVGLSELVPIPVLNGCLRSVWEWRMLIWHCHVQLYYCDMLVALQIVHTLAE
jgi:hypothetical protein